MVMVWLCKTTFLVNVLYFHEIYMQTNKIHFDIPRIFFRLQKICVRYLRHFLEAIICCYLERAVFYCDLTFKNHLSLLLSFFICRDTFLRMRKTLNAGFYFTLPLTFINRFQQIRDILKFEIKTSQQSI